MHDHPYISFGINVGMVPLGTVGRKQMSTYDRSSAAFDRVRYRKLLLGSYGKEPFVGGRMEDTSGQRFHIFSFHISRNICLDKYVHSLVPFHISQSTSEGFLSRGIKLSFDGHTSNQL